MNPYEHEWTWNAFSDDSPTKHTYQYPYTICESRNLKLSDALYHLSKAKYPHKVIIHKSNAILLEKDAIRFLKLYDL